MLALWSCAFGRVDGHFYAKAWGVQSIVLFVSSRLAMAAMVGTLMPGWIGWVSWWFLHTWCISVGFTLMLCPCLLEKNVGSMSTIYCTYDIHKWSQMYICVDVCFNAYVYIYINTHTHIYIYYIYIIIYIYIYIFTFRYLDSDSYSKPLWQFLPRHTEDVQTARLEAAIQSLWKKGGTAQINVSCY